MLKVSNATEERVSRKIVLIIADATWLYRDASRNIERVEAWKPEACYRNRGNEEEAA